MRQPPPATTAELMRLALEDPRYIIESGFSIVNKDKDIVPFVFNNLQNEFYENRTSHDDILKASQIGFSSMILAIETVKFLLVPNSWSVSIGYASDATQRLFERVDFYLNHLEPWLQPFVKLSTDRGDTLENELMHSKFYIGTQGSKSFGRGDTIHYAHLTEVSRWTDAGRTATSILRAMPNSKIKGDVWAVKETTANGQGNYHHIEYQRAKNGLSKFRSHFFPWFRHEEYTMPGVKLDPNTYDEDELHLLKRYPKDIDMARLAWRRDKINTLQSEDGRTPEEMFKQEFPSDDKEAFLFSGNPIFPAKQLEEMKDTAKKPIMRGNLVGVAPNQTLDETSHGWVKIWDFPYIGGQYVIFADVGQSSDFCSATVVDKKEWKVVATFHARINSRSFASELVKLGTYYNNALLAIEANNMGQSTIDKAIDLQYPNLYMRQVLDKKTKKTTEVVGWLTTSKTKPMMIGHMQDLVRQNSVDGMIPDEETLGEMATYIKKEDGSMGGAEGCFDDRVISCSGAFYVLKLHPFVTIKPKTKVKVRDRIGKYKELRTSTGRKRWRTYK